MLWLLSGSDVIEVSGLSCTGKTQVLLQAVASCVLPQNLGGEESCCIFFDCELKFDALRLQEMIAQRITRFTKETNSEFGPELSEDRVVQLVASCTVCIVLFCVSIV